MALGILENFDVAGHDGDGPEVAHLKIEAMKLAFADIWRYVADPRFMDVTPAQMLDKHYLKSRAKLIDPKKAKEFGPGVPKDGGTIYLGTADASGMMVSLIQSNYTGFGSGIVVPGTGIALQNRASGFVTTKGHANEVGPKKRPFHTIIPAFITKDGRPVATFGLMGGAMQPQGHMQVFSRIVDYGQNPQAAIDAPRWRVHETRQDGVGRGAHAGRHDERAGGPWPQAHAHQVAELRLRLQPDHLALPRGRPLPRRLRKPPRRRGGRVLMVLRSSPFADAAERRRPRARLSGHEHRLSHDRAVGA